MPCPLFVKRAPIPNSSVSLGAPRVLRPSMLHIAGFVALCELFLGCESHFALWKKLFCLVPHSQKGSIYQVGGAEVWCIAGTGYLSGTPKKTSEDWPSEWFYITDVPLPDPILIGLPEFDNAPLKKRRSWRPRSSLEEDDRDILYLMSRISFLARSGLTMIEVMATCIMRGCSRFSIEATPCGISTGRMTPPAMAAKGRDRLLI